MSASLPWCTPRVNGQGNVPFLHDGVVLGHEEKQNYIIGQKAELEIIMCREISQAQNINFSLKKEKYEGKYQHHLEEEGVLARERRREKVNKQICSEYIIHMYANVITKPIILYQYMLMKNLELYVQLYIICNIEYIYSM